MSTKISESALTEIIDSLAPLNNKLRGEQDPLTKIELMWDFGRILDIYITRHKVKPHELLYQIYDPHSTIKTSNITRDLGSYCYRIHKYFKTKGEIRNSLMHIKSYALFREAIPLLFNERYNAVEKKKILALLNSSLPNTEIKSRLVKLKQKIRPLKNPRNQKAYLYQDEGNLLKSLTGRLKEIYVNNNQPPNEDEINKVIGDMDFRKMLTDMLLALSSDAFLGRVSRIPEQSVPPALTELYKIALGKSINRSRFRRWVLSSAKLLSLAESIHALNDNRDYIFYRKKMIDPVPQKVK